MIAFTAAALTTRGNGFFAFTFGVLFAFEAIFFAAGLETFRVGAPFPRIADLVLTATVRFTAVFFFPFAAGFTAFFTGFTFPVVVFLFGAAGFFLFGFFFAVAILTSRK
ncbi:MAG: hypothetical protein AB1554_01525 [Chloroflexota bacterium]